MVHPILLAKLDPNFRDKEDEVQYGLELEIEKLRQKYKIKQGAKKHDIPQAEVPRVMKDVGDVYWNCMMKHEKTVSSANGLVSFHITLAWAYLDWLPLITYAEAEDYMHMMEQFVMICFRIPQLAPVIEHEDRGLLNYTVNEVCGRLQEHFPKTSAEKLSSKEAQTQMEVQASIDRIRKMAYEITILNDV